MNRKTSRRSAGKVAVAGIVAASLLTLGLPSMADEPAVAKPSVTVTDVDWSREPDASGHRPYKTWAIQSVYATLDPVKDGKAVMTAVLLTAPSACGEELPKGPMVVVRLTPKATGSRRKCGKN